MLTELLNHIFNALEVSPDFLMNRTIQNKTESSLSDNDLLNLFRKVEKLPDDKKRLVKEFPDAFMFKYYIQQQIASRSRRTEALFLWIGDCPIHSI